MVTLSLLVIVQLNETGAHRCRTGDIHTLSFFFFFSSRRRHTRLVSDWSSDVCSSDLMIRRPPRSILLPIASTVTIRLGLSLRQLFFATSVITITMTRSSGSETLPLSTRLPKASFSIDTKATRGSAVDTPHHI